MNVLVIGETCQDKFVYGSVERICPEAPVPVFCPKREEHHWGMAGNVYTNLKAIAKDRGDNYSSFTLFSNITQGYKERLVDEASNQLLVRVDTDQYIYSRSLKEINFSKYDVVIVSDYDKGFLSHDDINHISHEVLQANNKCLLFLDTKKTVRDGDFLFYDLIKINKKEFNENGFKEKYDSYRETLVVTMGAEGCMYNEELYPCQANQVFDVSGAGDTFLAALAYEYKTTMNIEKAIDFAQKCCSIVVGKKGVCTI